MRFEKINEEWHVSASFEDKLHEGLRSYAMEPNAGKGPSGSKVKAKLKSAIQNGRYYEAHQIYKTLFFRFLKFTNPINSIIFSHPWFFFVD